MTMLVSALSRLVIVGFLSLVQAEKNATGEQPGLSRVPFSSPFASENTSKGVIALRTRPSLGQQLQKGMNFVEFC